MSLSPKDFMKSIRTTDLSNELSVRVLKHFQKNHVILLTFFPLLLLISLNTLHMRYDL